MDKEIILITGINSKIAEPIILRLKDKFKILGVSRNIKKISKKYDEVTYIQHDLMNELKIKDKVKYVIHLGSYVPYNFCGQDNFELSYISNITMMQNLLKFSINQNIKKFIYTSSTDVYGRNNENILFEEATCSPNNYYGLSKKANEDLLNVYFHCYGLEFSAFRISYILSKDLSNDRFLKKLLNSIKNNESINLYNENNILNIIHVNEIANTIIKAIDGGNGIYNLSKEVSLNSFVEEAKYVYNSTSSVYYKYDHDKLNKVVFNNKKLLNYFGNDILLDLKETILKTVRV